MKRLLLPLFFLLPTLCLQAQATPKIVGYLQYQHAHKLDRMDLSRLTHLCIAFANPDANGYLRTDQVNIQPIVDRAKAANVQVLISLAGGAQRAEWKKAWAQLITPWQRKTFIYQIVQYVDEHGLDGVDLDLEWKSINQHYSGFVLELGAALHAKDKLFTAALPGKHRYPQLSDRALNTFDFINLMAYDLTGHWAPNKPGPHSPYSFARSCLKYWKKQGMPADKLVLGIPTYGWDFSDPKDVHSVNYADIVRSNAAYAHVDQVGSLYYNGLLTVTAKAELAANQAAGVMIWELGKDDYGSYSILAALYAALHKQPLPPPALPKKIEPSPPPPDFVGPVRSADYTDTEDFQDETFTDSPLKLNIAAHPNPFEDSLQITNLEAQVLHLVMTNQQGQTLYETTLLPQASIHWETASFPPGYYVLSAYKGRRQLSKQLVKQLQAKGGPAQPRDAARNRPQH